MTRLAMRSGFRSDALWSFVGLVTPAIAYSAEYRAHQFALYEKLHGKACNRCLRAQPVGRRQGSSSDRIKDRSFMRGEPMLGIIK